MDFLGCGESERLDEWSEDLWYEWGNQVVELCHQNGFDKVNLIGCSGGTIAAINIALEHPELVEHVVADSFEGIKADADMTEQIQMGRNYAKSIERFKTMMQVMHGDDWEQVLDADTNAVIAHATHIGDFFHRPISDLKCKLLLTGSTEDEMFSKGHYEAMLEDIYRKNYISSS